MATRPTPRLASSLASSINDGRFIGRPDAMRHIMRSSRQARRRPRHDIHGDPRACRCERLDGYVHHRSSRDLAILLRSILLAHDRSVKAVDQHCFAICTPVLLHILAQIAEPESLLSSTFSSVPPHTSHDFMRGSGTSACHQHHALGIRAR